MAHGLKSILGRYYVRACPSCRERIGMMAYSIDVCPRCSCLMSAERPFAIAASATVALAVIVGIYLGFSAAPVVGFIAFLAAGLLFLPISFLSATIAGASPVRDPAQAVKAVKQCYYTSHDYAPDRKEFIRAAVKKEAKAIFESRFPVGRQVEYKRYLYSVVGVGNDLSLTIESGRDREVIQPENISLITHP